MINKYLSDSVNGVVENQGWIISVPANILLDITPPNVFQGLQSMPINFGDIGGFKFVHIGKVRTIDEGLHNNLLEQSLQENGELWRRLAQR